MILTVQQSLIIILLISLITFLLRVIPFMLFPANKKTPKYIVCLSTVLPYAIIGMLIVYCLKAVSVSSFPFGLPEFISIIFIVIIHTWKKNALFSIGGGTILYMLLTQLIFS
jgi:branched-subunit amino acid transport protein AzlD